MVLGSFKIGPTESDGRTIFKDYINHAFRFDGLKPESPTVEDEIYRINEEGLTPVKLEKEAQDRLANFKIYSNIEKEIAV